MSGAKGLRQEQQRGRPRAVRHVVRVHPETEHRLLAAAAIRGISVSRLLVESALAGGADAAARKAELAGELFRVTRFLGRVGVNINQIARAANAGAELKADASAALRAISDVTRRIELLLDDVEGRL